MASGEKKIVKFHALTAEKNAPTFRKKRDFGGFLRFLAVFVPASRQENVGAFFSAVSHRNLKNRSAPDAPKSPLSNARTLVKF